MYVEVELALQVVTAKLAKAIGCQLTVGTEAEVQGQRTVLHPTSQLVRDRSYRSA